MGRRALGWRCWAGLRDRAGCADCNRGIGRCGWGGMAWLGAAARWLMPLGRLVGEVGWWVRLGAVARLAAMARLGAVARWLGH